MKAELLSSTAVIQTTACCPASPIERELEADVRLQERFCGVREYAERAWTTAIPGGTFCVLKGKELHLCREYRTKCLVLRFRVRREIWKRSSQLGVRRSKLT